MQFLGYNPFPGAATLSEQLAAGRQFMNLSQREMARRLRVDPTTLGRWERGERKPGGVYLQRLKKLGVLPTPSGVVGTVTGAEHNIRVEQAEVPSLGQG